MGRKDILLTCTKCDDLTLHYSLALTPVLHIVAFVVTGGLWLIAWVLISGITHKPTCSQCGTKNYSRGRRALQFVAGLGLLISLYAYVITGLMLGVDVQGGERLFWAISLTVCSVLYLFSRIGI